MKAKIKNRILDVVSATERRRIRPIDLERQLLRERMASRSLYRSALGELVREGQVVYSYRDPCSFVELPRN